MNGRMLGAMAALALAACGSPPAAIDFYSLTASPPAPPAAGAASFSVHVGPVTVPDGVDRPQMVVRLSDNRVDIDDQHRWAEPLRDAIPRALADDLARELGTPRVMTSRQSATLDFDYRVAVDIQHFESSYADGAYEDVLWTLRGAKGREPRVGRTTVREPAASGDAAGVAAAHGRALQRVAHDIAAAIRAMEGR
ncbi:MAG TPA: PqiC family protein [Usitatibacter sp.]|nr:PqiC family protein [Usitatibacter sp.]